MASPSGRVFGKLLSLNPSVDHIDLTKRETVLGRNNTAADIVFDSLQVSKQHCKIICSDAGVFVRDLRCVCVCVCVCVSVWCGGGVVVVWSRGCGGSERVLGSAPHACAVGGCPH